MAIYQEQPANASIEIFRTVRTYRNALRQESLKVLAPMHGRGLVTSVPGREYLAAQTHDGVVSDAFRFGHPVVTFARNFVSLNAALTSITHAKLVGLIGGRDLFITKESGNNTEDTHGQARAADALVNPTATINPLTP
ncbi:MAG: hypothetical protein Q8K86_08255 [Candidatus Nanopelagicaceae bacterium]|nr:hypothetical protein [Candidatus Nanopelagicaceae bacterium]